MNSEVLQYKNELTERRKQEEYERQSNLESKTVAEGSAAHEFVNQPFWKVLVNDLMIEHDKMMVLLKNPSLNMLKDQIKVLQIRISDIELFIESPNKYLASLQDLNRRRLKKG